MLLSAGISQLSKAQENNSTFQGAIVSKLAQLYICWDPGSSGVSCEQNTEKAEIVWEATPDSGTDFVFKWEEGVGKATAYFKPLLGYLAGS